MNWTRTGNYTEEFADHMLDAVGARAGKAKSSEQLCPIDGAAPRRSQATDAEQRAHDRVLRDVVMKLHVQCGHPDNTYLARAIRLAHGSDRAVEMALSLRCDVCDRQRRPAPSLPATLLAKWTKFNSCLCLDTLTLADVAGETRLFLSMVDYASRFGICVQVPSRHPSRSGRQCWKDGRVGQDFRRTSWSTEAASLKRNSGQRRKRFQQWSTPPPPTRRISTGLQKDMADGGKQCADTCWMSTV